MVFDYDHFYFNVQKYIEQLRYESTKKKHENNDWLPDDINQVRQLTNNHIFLFYNWSSTYVYVLFYSSWFDIRFVLNNNMIDDSL